MKVAIVTPGTFSVPSERNSSVEKVIMNICQPLKRSIDFAVFSKKEPGLPTEEIDDGIRMIRPECHDLQGYLLGTTVRLKNMRPDLVQVENRPRYALAIKRRLPGCPVWLSVHSTRFITKPHISPSLLRTCLRAADRIIVNSQFLGRFLSRLAPRSAKKIVVQYPGIDTSLFVSRWSAEGRRMREQHLRQLSYENKKLILYAGRLLPSKGIHHVLRVMPRIASAFPDAILVIVGGARYGQNTLTPYVKRLHAMGNALPCHVRFIPFADYREMNRWYASADMLVVPSGGHEAFGLVNIEAMSSGIPVIAAKAGGIKEIVRHGENGFLIEPNQMEEQLYEHILRLLHDDRLVETLGKQGEADVQARFSQEQAARRWLRLYQCTSAVSEDSGHHMM